MAFRWPGGFHMLTCYAYLLFIFFFLLDGGFILCFNFPKEATHGFISFTFPN